MSFEKLYTQLNSSQQAAVDTIDGPVLVVAGPGTGKTQLLSMRVANILLKRDVTPKNILCLTFTEDAAKNMRERLATIIGQSAYDVEIHTFHSFGASVIAKYGEYFYHGVGNNPIDDLKAHQIFEEIFKNLPHDNPLSIRRDDSFMYLDGAKQAIDNCKSAGLDAEEVEQIARSNQAFIDIANPKIAKSLRSLVRINKNSVKYFEELHEALMGDHAESETSNNLPSFVKPLADVIIPALEKALDEFNSTQKTTPLTNFKDTFLKKNKKDEWQLKDTETTAKLHALASIYEKYLHKLREDNLLDFNDMITRVVHALETFDELRLNLQEQYQYILVDEFQDTSISQLRIIHALTNNPIFEEQPNILAVGDDDQAIYSFQGAELSNILTFHKLYKNVKIITLTDNYRSHQDILDLAKFVIEKSEERLVNKIDSLNKNILAKNTSITSSRIKHSRFASADSQNLWISEQIADFIKNGEQPEEIAIIAKNHKSLKAIAPFLQTKNIPIQYDKRENILEHPAINALLEVLDFINDIAKDNIKLADSKLPRILSLEFWGLSTKQIWQLYVEHYKKRAPWLEIANNSKDSQVVDIANFLISLSTKIPHLSLETILDIIIGNKSLETDASSGDQLSLAPQGFTSPFKEYYFHDDIRRKQPIEYLELLSHLRFLRDKLREFKSAETVFADDLLQYVTLCKKAGLNLVDTSPHREQQNAVKLYSAHSSKGLEFKTIFLIDSNQDVWSRSGSHQGKITPPSNLPIERSSGDEDERRRLLFVALTRAKQNLILTGFNGKKQEANIVKFLHTDENAPGSLTPIDHNSSLTEENLQAKLNVTWHDRHHPKEQPELTELLRPKIEKYKLSITHLQKFLNVAEGGPQTWLMQSILRFPQAPVPNMAYGSAIHETLDKAHKFVKLNNTQKSMEEILQDFAEALSRQHVEIEEQAKLKERGEQALRHYFAERYSLFSPQEYFEFDLQSRGLYVGETPVTGKIDRITPLGNNSFKVTDFKTGKASYSWQGSDPFKKIRLHQYKQQLAFYRLLLENGKVFGNTKIVEAALEFVEPDNGELAPLLTYSPSDEELERLQQLIKASWQHMKTLDFPDISKYDKSLKGILQFEDDLINF